jgi:hypothetical protein
MKKTFYSVHKVHKVHTVQRVQIASRLISYTRCQSR